MTAGQTISKAASGISLGRLGVLVATDWLGWRRGVAQSVLHQL